MNEKALVELPMIEWLCRNGERLCHFATAEACTA